MRKRYWLVAGTAVISLLLYVVVSAWGDGPGFPLDDGWIHQTYARNLARSGRWEYVPGVVSSGSTAPLWTLLLAVGYLLRIPFLAWVYLWGAVSLAWLGGAGIALWRELWPERREQDWIAGLVLVLTWPLIWAAASGMETVFFMALGVTIASLYIRLLRDRRQPEAGWQLALLGVLSGLLVLTRPDGMVLLLLIGLGLGLAPVPARHRVPAVAIWIGTAVLPLIPYFIFNWRASGTLWPNTFYAKQAEYAVELARPFLLRLLQLTYFSLGGAESGWRGVSGAHWLLLPGLVTAAWQALRRDWAGRRLSHLLPLLWAGGHIFLYAWRLPVTYQHGRYLMAAMPVWVIYGVAGWLWLLARLPGQEAMVRVVRRVLVLTFTGLLVVFFLLGGLAFRDDVAFIENEMVATAFWLNENTAPTTLIAAHDIGAIGYFAERPLLDLAGLVSPQIIGLLDDEAALGAFILNSSADYLVTAPGWPYAAVVRQPDVELRFTTNYAWTRDQGRNNMAVYELPP